jgi:glycolate oxidase iron-sulfur subunit
MERILGPQTEEYVYHCNKCGLCLASCPVYKEELIEHASPRGKVQLIRYILEGELDISPRMKEILSKCLLCGSCVAACPSGVHGDRLFSGLRWRATQRYGLDWKKKVLFQMLSRKWATSTSAKMASWAQKIFGTGGGKGLILGGLPLSRIPPFSPKPFSEQVPELLRPKGEVKGRVLYFHGCSTDFLFPQVGHAVVEVLCRMGLEVHIPKGQGCCGIPVFMSGAREMAIDLIKDTLMRFAVEDVEAVIVDCATCGIALRREYRHLLQEMADLGEDPDSGLIQSAERLASKVRDVSEYVAERISWLGPFGGGQVKRLRVTYHDPCHLLKGQGIGRQPREILRALPGIEFVEMENPDACCGGGGSFQVEHPSISQAITSKKIKGIYNSSADAVATGCPGCRITISAHLDQDRGISVLHPLELVRMELEDLQGEQGISK